MEDSELTTERLSGLLTTSGQQAPPAPRQLCLVVTEGPEKGALISLTPGSSTILGRSAHHADHVLSGRGMSRAHARVSVDSQDRVQVEDLGSTNGIFINGVKTQQGELKLGDSLSLSPDVTLELEAQGQSIQSLLQELQHEATRDALTGLLNRRSFMERLDEEVAASLRHKLPTCVAILDVDHFKKVNDTYGHPAGDAVLVGVAQRLKQAKRNEDVVARFGGEEFVLLLRHTDHAGALVLMDRLRLLVADQTFEVPTPSGPQFISVTFSSGYTQLGATDASDKVLERADIALYEAKRTGRNRVICRLPGG